jgi:outer membrane protein assembly factor BamB
LPSGYSSPVLAGERIFLTAYEGKKLLTLCLDRKTGKVLWRREITKDRDEKLDSRNNPAAPTAVTDGKDVYVFFSEFGVVSYDLEGNERWKVRLGPFNNIYGMGASPILADDKVILPCDQSTNSYVIALGKEDGRVHWKTDRPEAISGHSTPILYQPDSGSLQIIIPGSFLLTAYSVDTGEKVWWVSGLSVEMKSTPILVDGIVYINGYATPLNQPGKHISIPTFEEALGGDADQNGRLVKEEVDDRARSMFDFVDLDGDGFLDADNWAFYRAAMASTNGLLAIKAGGKGDMTDTNIVWQYHRAVPQLPSPLLYEGVLYMVNDGGIVTSLDPKTGERIAQGRLKGAVDKYYASPVASNGKVYMLSEQGKMAVLKPDGSLETIAVSDLGEPCYATPAIGSEGRMYLRTVTTLYCFGNSP